MLLTKMEIKILKSVLSACIASTARMKTFISPSTVWSKGGESHERELNRKKSTLNKFQIVQILGHRSNDCINHRICHSLLRRLVLSSFQVGRIHLRTLLLWHFFSIRDKSQDKTNRIDGTHGILRECQQCGQCFGCGNK
jgi:hypothetical protein